MGDIRERLNDRDQLHAQITLAKSELAKRYSEEETLGDLVQQSETLLIAVGKALGKLSSEYFQARLTFLLLADARGDAAAHVARTRAHLEQLEEATS